MKLKCKYIIFVIIIKIKIKYLLYVLKKFCPTINRNYGIVNSRELKNRYNQNVYFMLS